MDNFTGTQNSQFNKINVTNPMSEIMTQSCPKIGKINALEDNKFKLDFKFKLDQVLVKERVGKADEPKEGIVL